MKPRSRSRQGAVFATARFEMIRHIGGQTARVPASLVHAKTMGTTVTMCGESSLSWFKFWDIAFVNVRGERCLTCVTAFERWLGAGPEGH